jgi:hypothetical protein
MVLCGACDPRARQSKNVKSGTLEKNRVSLIGADGFLIYEKGTHSFMLRELRVLKR